MKLNILTFGMVLLLTSSITALTPSSSDLHAQPTDKMTHTQPVDSMEMVAAAGAGEGYKTPDWVKDAIFYQIFPDRFRNGDPNNDAVGDGHSGDVLWENWRGPGEGNPMTTPIVHWPVIYAKEMGWDNDPEYKIRGTSLPSSPEGYPSTEARCLGRDWFGGDLKGVQDAIPYLTELGITAIYFNPIFDSTDIHGYSIIDFKSINRYFGAPPRRENHPYAPGGFTVIPDHENSIKVFENMVAALHLENIKVVLDGVFNHCSAKNMWFDRDDDFPTDGAFESQGSRWYGWFNFYEWPRRYQGWGNYTNIPKINDSEGEYKDYIYKNPENSVIKFWHDLGIDGWRLDVPNEIKDPDFWREFRKTYKGLNENGYIIGEIWTISPEWLNEDGFDALMNYPWKSAVIAWANGGSVSDFETALARIKEAYPKEAFYASFNLLGSHDDPRPLYYLGDKAKMKLAVIFQMTYPGAPVIYYGDEVGMSVPSQFVGTCDREIGRDPNDRQTYPWPDVSTLRSPDEGMLDHYKKLINIRKSYSVLRTGELKTKLVDEVNGIYVLARWDNSSAPVAILVYNNSSSTRSVTLDVSDLENLKDGDLLTDVLDDRMPTYTVSDGRVTVDVRSLWARVLIKLPLGVPSLSSPTSGAQWDDMPTSIKFEWSSVRGAISYDLQVDDDIDFKDPEINLSLENTTYEYMGALSDASYYWRVRARDNEGNVGAWSSSRLFEIGEPLLAPSLILPYNNMEVQIPPTFMWSAVACDNYKLQIDDDSGFSSPENIIENANTYTLTTLPEGVYFWRVQVMKGGKSKFSSVQSFTKVPPPELEVTMPPEETKIPSWTLTGEAVENTRIRVSIGGENIEVTVGADNKFGVKVSLSQGRNSIEVIAIDNSERTIARSTKKVFMSKLGDASLVSAPFIEAGERCTFDLSGSGLPSIEVTLTARNKVEAPSMTVENAELPEDTHLPPGIAYGYINISTNFSSQDLRTAEVRFRVEKSWVREHGVDERKVGLWKYENEWQPMWTGFAGEDDEFFYYSAVGESLSLLAIAGERAPSMPAVLYYMAIWAAFAVCGAAVYIFGGVMLKKWRAHPRGK